MKRLTDEAILCFWSVFFMHSVVQNIGVAPDFHGQNTFQFSGLTKSAGEDILVNNDESCPVICLCYIKAHQMITDCSEKQLEDIPPAVHATTFELILFRNKLSNLTYNSTLNKLEILNISNNYIIDVDRTWLSSLVNLQSLDISKNNLKTGLKMFSNLPLRYLNLSDNRLCEINGELLHALTLLEELYLSNNDIYEISDDSFQSLISLVTLDLSSNRLVNLKHEWFMNLRNLRSLLIKNNRLQQLSNVAFWGLNNLQQLDVSENAISSIGLLSFKGLQKLSALNISNNKIGLLQGGIFRPLEQVKIIDLSNNLFQNLDGVFKHSENLEILYLKNLISYKTLTASSLLGLTQLKALHLSGSKSLSHIHQYAFSTTKKLTSLDISSTNLSSLKNGIFKELKSLEYLKIKGNPWRCDCYLYWILLWLGENTNTHLLSPTETVCHSPTSLKHKVLLDALDHDMVCTNASIQQYTKNAQFGVGSTALLQCQADGSPLPIVTWVTPHKFTFHWLHDPSNASLPENSILSKNHPENHAFMDEPDAHDKERFLLMKNGDLLIRNVERGDGGFYICIASNPLSNHSVAIKLTLDYKYLVHIKIVSILVGMATSFGFLLLTLVTVLITMVLKQCGIKCPCNSGKSSPKAQQIRKVLESMEHYKKQQLDRLRENYNFQVQRIKDNCMQQMERLRESYSSQAERLRDIRDYGTLQIDRIRENYYFQVQRVRDYSTSQIERLRENYIFQRNRIRKFSTHHLYKLRENYKLQQQHLNKILENLNIESCRNVCQRTDSVVFEPDITLENVFVPKICLAQSISKNSNSVDNSSQISAYFTPEEAGSETSGQDSDDQECMHNYLNKGVNIAKIQSESQSEQASSLIGISRAHSCEDIESDIEMFTSPKLLDADETVV